MRTLAITISIAFFAVAVAVFLGTPGSARYTEADEGSGGKTRIYVLLHAEDEVALKPSPDCPGALVTDCTPFLNNNLPAECCLEVLTPLGEKRAQFLARWFRDRGIVPTHVFASHKHRTLLTVTEIAADAGLANDVDLVADGVQQLPPLAMECDPGFEIAHLFFQQTVEALDALPLGSVAVVCGHSGSVYPILEDLGIDTSDPIDFPKTPTGRVKGFDNLWVVKVDKKGRGDLKAHLVFDFALKVRRNP